MPGPYRGTHRARPINRNCPTERDYNYFQPGCYSTCHGYVCTRPAGHDGDHVGHTGPDTLTARWGPNGETEDD